MALDVLQPCYNALKFTTLTVLLKQNKFNPDIMLVAGTENTHNDKVFFVIHYLKVSLSDWYMAGLYTITGMD